MIICLSGFVIAGAPPALPAPACSRDAVALLPYAPHHRQLLQSFAPRAGGARCSSSSESASSPSASPPPGAPPAAPPAAGAAGAGGGRRVRTLYACVGESEGELSFEPNQIITDVSASAEPGWLRGSLDGRSGLVPQNYVEPLP